MGLIGNQTCHLSVQGVTPQATEPHWPDQGIYLTLIEDVWANDNGKLVVTVDTMVLGVIWGWA